MEHPMNGKSGEDEKGQDMILLERFRAGEQAAFDTLLNKYMKAVYNLTYSFCGNAQDAEDLSQEAWVKAYHNLKTFEARASFYTWLRKIVVNHCLNFLQVRRRHFTFSANDAQPVADDPPPEPNHETRLDMQNAIQMLPDNHKMTVILRYYENLSYEEIAQTMRCSTGTVMSRLHYARKKIKETLTEAHHV